MPSGAPECGRGFGIIAVTWAVVLVVVVGVVAFVINAAGQLGVGDVAVLVTCAVGMAICIVALVERGASGLFFKPQRTMDKFAERQSRGSGGPE